MSDLKADLKELNKKENEILSSLQQKLRLCEKGQICVIDLFLKAKEAGVPIQDLVTLLERENEKVFSYQADWLRGSVENYSVGARNQEAFNKIEKELKASKIKKELGIV